MRLRGGLMAVQACAHRILPSNSDYSDHAGFICCELHVTIVPLKSGSAVGHACLKANDALFFSHISP